MTSRKLLFFLIPSENEPWFENFFSKALINELEKYLFISRIDPMIRFAFVVFLMGFQSLCGVVDFEKEVWPILDKRCVECHKAPYEINGVLKKPKAGLRLDGAAYIMHGGDEGPVVVANHPSRSPLYQRVVLPADDGDHMPPKGEPLTHPQKEVLRKWIAQGLDFGKWEGQTDGIEKLVQKKNEDSSIFIPEHIKFYDKLSAGLKPLPKAELSRIAKATGLMIRPIGIGSPLLEVRVVADPLQVGDAEVKELRPLKKHLAKLDLRHADITEGSMAEIATYLKLTELNLRGTKVGNFGLSKVILLPCLQTLNLCETDVSDKGLSLVKKSKSLRKVFLWDTRVSVEGQRRVANLLVIKER